MLVTLTRIDLVVTPLSVTGCYNGNTYKIMVLLASDELIQTNLSRSNLSDK